MNTRTDTHDSYGFPLDAAFPWRPKMNTRANELHTTQREPICLDDLAFNHYWRLIKLRDLLTHVEEINIEHPTVGGDYEAAIAAMLYSALVLAREATDEAERLNVFQNQFNIRLMAMPGELLPGEDDWSVEHKAHTDKTPPTLDDIRASLTAEEIETAARAFAAGLEGYLKSALSHPANQGLQVQGEDHEPA